MPHFIAKSHQISFPFSKDGLSFKEEFFSLCSKESLILVQGENTEFLIRKAPHLKGWLFKSEKIMRPNSTGILKNALSILADHCEVLSDNLTITSRRQKIQSRYMLEGDNLLLELQKNREWILEIGFGSGRHLLNLAKNSPQQYFLGIEIHMPSLEQVQNQIELLGLKNLFLTRLDARILLNFLPSNSLQRIYLHFPVPWNKKPHRRVLTKAFLTEAMRALKKDSYLHLRTDDKEYFSDALKLAIDSQASKINVRKNSDFSVISKYEARWKKQDKDIYDIEFYSLFESDKLDLTYDFSLPFVECIPQNLVGKKVLGKDFFLHIHRCYKAKDSIILSISFGDFNWPNSRYLWIDFKKCSIHFLGAPILPIFANIQAHQALIQLLGA